MIKITLALGLLALSGLLALLMAHDAAAQDADQTSHLTHPTWQTARAEPSQTAKERQTDETWAYRHFPD